MKYDEVIILKVTAALKAKLKAAAEKDGRTLSNYIRIKLEKK